MIAGHDHEPRLPVVATLYTGTSSADSVQAATIESSLCAKGAGRPTISMYLRSRKWIQGQGWQHQLEEELRLAVTDADEVSRALAHLVQVADSE